MPEAEEPWQAELSSLLSELFVEPQKLLQFLKLQALKQVATEVDGTTMSNAASTTALALEAHGEVAGIWEKLDAKFPGRAADIAVVRKAWQQRRDDARSSLSTRPKWWFALVAVPALGVLYLPIAGLGGLWPFAGEPDPPPIDDDGPPVSATTGDSEEPPQVCIREAMGEGVDAGRLEAWIADARKVGFDQSRLDLTQLGVPLLRTAIERFLERCAGVTEDDELWLRLPVQVTLANKPLIGAAIHEAKELCTADADGRCTIDLQSIRLRDEAKLQLRFGECSFAEREVALHDLLDAQPIDVPTQKLGIEVNESGDPFTKTESVTLQVQASDACAIWSASGCDPIPPHAWSTACHSAGATGGVARFVYARFPKDVTEVRVKAAAKTRMIKFTAKSWKPGKIPFDWDRPIPDLPTDFCRDRTGSRVPTCRGIAELHGCNARSTGDCKKLLRAIESAKTVSATKSLAIKRLVKDAPAIAVDGTKLRVPHVSPCDCTY